MKKTREGIQKLIWLPDALVVEIEKLRAPLGLTFRAVVIAALREWVRRERRKGDER